MLILGLDLETTGLDLVNDKIIEIGAVLWDTDKNKPVKLLNELIYPMPNFNLPENITEITGIRSEELLAHGKHLPYILDDILNMVEDGMWICAHNANKFDKPFLINEAERHCKANPFNRPWIDTRTDLPLPPHIKSKKLIHLAAEHDFLNPFTHRAVFDVLTMFKIMSNYPIEKIIERAKSPLIKITALVSYQQKELAKDEGFYWNSEQRVWEKELKEMDLKKYPFKYEQQLELGI